MEVDVLHWHGANKGMWGRGLLGEDMVMKMQPGRRGRPLRPNQYAHISNWR